MNRKSFRRARTLPLLFLSAASLFLSACKGGEGSTEGFLPDPDSPTVTVRPAEIAGILYNPGMGVADFHFGWGNPPPPGEYPPRPSPTSAGRGTNSSRPRGSTTSVWWMT